MVTALLRALVAAALAERWAPLPTGPADEFALAAPRVARAVPDYVSTLGRVVWVSAGGAGIKSRRLDRPPGGRKRPHWRVNLYRPATPAVGGQPRDPLTGRWLPGSSDGRARYVAVRVSRLVLATFAGPASNLEPLGRHGVCGSLDDSLRNLTRGTYAANLRDAYERGERGERGASKQALVTGAGLGRRGRDVRRYNPPDPGAVIPF